MGLPVEVNNLMMGSLGGYNINRSLRFRSSASAYLSRTIGTPSTTTNTFSVWVKRGSTINSAYNPILMCTNNNSGINYQLPSTSANDTIQILDNGTTLLATSAVYRDPSAWYHVVVVWDSTNATSTDRVRLYVNGSRVTAFGTTNYPVLNATFSLFSASNPWQIGSRQFPGALYFDGYMAEINYIDGQALTASSFGAYDTNGVWQPKKYSGTYGTNGFYLPFTSGFNTTQAYAGSFNGSNQFLSVASSASLSPSTGNFTVEANINLNTLPSSNSYAAIFENQIATTSASSDKFYVAVKNNAGTYRLEIGQHSTANVAYVNWTPTVGTWYHVAVVRQSGTILLFINGVQQTVTNSTVFNGTNFGQNGASIGAISTPLYFNGYISNARYVVGSAVYTTGFTPPSSNLTNITNTQWLTLQNATIIDNSSAARTITNNGSVVTSNQYPFQYTLASISADYSGNNNNWTTNNINATFLGTTYDSMIDSPTNAAGTSTGIGNYATWNPIFPFGNQTFSNGNLSVATGTTGGAIATISVSSGKWYWEVNPTTIAAGTPRVAGLVQAITAPTSLTSKSIYLQNDGKYSINGAAAVTYGGAITTSDIVGVAVDVDAQTVTFYKNGTAMGSAISISSVYTSGDLIVPAIVQSGGANNAQDINFGQRPFSYTPPSGYKALNTYNLPAPSIANGAKYMAATTYTANGTTQSISNAVNGVSFQPDLVWQKRRNSAGSHYLADSLRGTSKLLSSDTTAAEATNTIFLTSFNSDGWSQGTGNYTNGESIVGWQWKAGGTGVTNTSGTITSTVSANPSAGFSIVTYTGTGSLATVGHGLGVAPDLIIWKNRSSVQNWVTYHRSLGASGNVYLNLTAGYSADSTTHNNTAPTSSVFTVATSGAVNGSTNNLVAYCFSAVSGYSAFGKYTGNGSADGPFIYTGFKPRWVMIKNTQDGTTNWYIYDTSRGTYNIMSNYLMSNLSNAEASFSAMDYLSNGFKIRTSNLNFNNSGQTHIYAAFAESPFQISRAR